MRMRLRPSGKLVVAGFVLAASAAVPLWAVIGGFGGPLLGLATAPNGDLLVVDAGAGIIGLRGGRVVSTIPLPGASDVSPIGRSAAWVTHGGEAPGVNVGQGLFRVSNGQVALVADLWEFETTVNPDGKLPFNSNPFDVESLGGQAALVADAGANALLRINNQGHIDIMALFPDEDVSSANIKDLAGCPSPAPFCGFPDVRPAEAVPTSVVTHTDGYYYVGELKGIPAPTDESNIWRVSPGAHEAVCGASADCVKVFDGGFTSIIDLAFGPDGLLYVAEMDERSWAAVQIFGTPTGGSINACNLVTLTCEEVATGISMLTAISFGTDGSLWATRNALVPGGAEVIQVP